jgi:hypothetical protein
VPARFTGQPHAATKGLAPRLASDRPGTERSAAGYKPWARCLVTARHGPLGADGSRQPHLAVYRLRADGLATAVERDGQGSNP